MGGGRWWRAIFMSLEEGDIVDILTKELLPSAVREFAGKYS